MQYNAAHKRTKYIYERNPDFTSGSFVYVWNCRYGSTTLDNFAQYISRCIDRINIIEKVFRYRIV